MKDKAYIVTNEEQEREVLEKLDSQGSKWQSGKTPTENSYLIEETITFFVGDDNQLTFEDGVNEGNLTNYEIVFDGRKEEHMSDKYVVSQEFMKGLEDWKEILRLDNVLFIGRKALSNLPNLLDKWWRDGSVSVHESNNRLIAIIRWVNGEDVFEVEKPKKWVVRSKDTDVHGDYWYVYVFNTITSNRFNKSDATKFDTKEEAESWANSHQEVIEVVDV